MAMSQGCSGSHPPEYHCSGCDLIGQQYRFMLAAWAHPIGCHSVYIWAHCSGAHPIATHTDYPYRLSSLVRLSPDCHLVYIWARCSGAHPIATHTFSPVRLSPDCHSVDIWACHLGVHPIATLADLHASRALTRLPFGIYLFSPFGHAGWALTRLPFGKYLVSPFGHAPS